MDPISKVSIGDYATFNNNPVLFKDIKGNDGEKVVGSRKVEGSVTFNAAPSRASMQSNHQKIEHMKRKNLLQSLQRLLKTVRVAFLCGVMLFIIGCKNTDDQMGIAPIEEAVLRQKALWGNEDAYNRLSSFYIVNLKYDKAYAISLVVAEKYHNKEAYSTLSWCLLNKAELGGHYKMLKSLDKRTQFLCLYYLLKAKELGEDGTDAHYKEMLPEFRTIPPSSVFLDSLRYIDSAHSTNISR